MRLCLLVVLALVGVGEPVGAQAPAGQHNSNGLYDQMRACLAETSLRMPCAMVDRARGFVVIKDYDPAKPDAYLIVPATEITGIEDPRALRRPVVRFWDYGWQIGEHLLGRPPEQIGLAINSEAGRSQNLLHIHISCSLRVVRDALDGARIGTEWASEPFVSFRGHQYNARKLDSLAESPFLLLRELPAARRDMAAQSLAVIGSAKGGYYLLNDQTLPGAPAEAEDLLDESCE